MTRAPSREEAAQAQFNARLHDPAVSAALSSLLDHADLLAILVEGLDDFVERSEVIAESLSAGFGELRGAMDGEALAKAGADLGRLRAAATSLMSSDPLKPEALETIGVLARGMVRGNAAYSDRPVQVRGLLSLARLLKDPDINRALSFVVTLAKHVGQELNAPTATTVTS